MSVRIIDAEVQRHVAVLDLSDGRTVIAPLPEMVRVAPKQLRRNWVLIGEGAGIHWPRIGDDLLLDEVLEPPLLRRRCRFCDFETLWNATSCEGCGKDRWNDPDDTELGRSLGQEERSNYETALAAAKLDRLKKL